MRQGRRGRGGSISQVRGRGRGAHFSVCMRWECYDTLVKCLIFIFPYTMTTQLSFSAVFSFCVLIRYQPVMIAKNFFCVSKN